MPTTTSFMELLMNQDQEQDQKPLAVQNVQKAQAHLIEARQNFYTKFGIYPSVMYVGPELFRTAFPAAHAFRKNLPEAIETTLILPKDSLHGWGLVIVKPPELRRAAA